MVFTFSVSTPSGPHEFHVEAGTSLYFVGANGGGKTRLAVQIENEMGENAHRISAHRALALNPAVPKLSEREALRGLRFGVASQAGQLHHRPGSRWGNNAAVSLLNDYDHLVQALFAEQANTSLETHRLVRAGSRNEASPTKFEKLVEIWDRVLPHRKLHITGDDVRVSPAGSTHDYPASEMSDGERAAFYLIGQALVAADDSLIIVDEPELHVHRAILSPLWDQIEASRPDCAFVVISHDLEFIASREGQKFVLREYAPETGWDVEAVPEDTGFSDEIATLILGSRQPVLFVEGDGGSLDQAIYRVCYPQWTVIPRGSCEEVIHAVVTMRANSSLTRVACAGVVDADAYGALEIQLLSARGIAVLPVSEIENLFLLPDVINAIAQGEGFAGAALDTRREQVLNELFVHASDPKNQLASVMRYCRRRIDRTLKLLDLSAASDVATLAAEYACKTGELDVVELADAATQGIQGAIAARDARELLKWYDNKGLLAIACKAKGTSKAQFEQWLVRVLRNGSAPGLSDALRQRLPLVHASSSGIRLFLFQ